MSHSPKPSSSIQAKQEPKLFGTYAEFDNVGQLLAGCRRVRDAGYLKTDAYTPFPVHGIDKALGIKPTILPWICLACGLTGLTIALTMQIWMNAIDYPYIISGKPFISLPAFIPVSFELTVLLSAFGAFFGMLALNKLPMFSNAVFTDPRFDRATDDRFFLFISADDAKYKNDSVMKLLGDMGSGHVSDIYEDTSSDVIPKPFFVAVGLLALLATVPLLALARMRVTNSGSPRFHVFYDMDFSPSKDAQKVTTLFADGRTMRPDVPGTIAIGQYDEVLDFYTGIDMEQLSRLDAPRATRLVRAFRDEPAATEGETLAEDVAETAKEVATSQTEATKAAEKGTSGEKAASDKSDSDLTPEKAEPVADTPKPEAKKIEQPAEPSAPAVMPEPSPVPTKVEAAAPVGAVNAVAPAAPVAVDKTPWLKENPLPMTSETLQAGQKYFEIYCAVCHGNDGGGNGLVNRRAQRILATAWVQPSSMHQDTLYTDQYADGKLFSTISNGIRKMPGYSAQITAKNRWAIVAYVRALQASQNAQMEDVPGDKQNELKKLQAEVAKRLAEQAEAEKKKAEAAAIKS